MERAIFISRTAAHTAIVQRGRAIGMSNEDIAKHGRTYPKIVRGEMRGYEAWYPVEINGKSAIRNPIMENAA